MFLFVLSHMRDQHEKNLFYTTHNKIPTWLQSSDPKYPFSHLLLHDGNSISPFLTFQCDAGATYRSSFTVFIISDGEQHNTYNKYFTCDRFLKLNKLEQCHNVKTVWINIKKKINTLLSFVCSVEKKVVLFSWPSSILAFMLMQTSVKAVANI